MTTNYKSKCCGADVKTCGTGDFHEKDEVCTCHFECSKCLQPCDIEPITFKDMKKLKLKPVEYRKAIALCDFCLEEKECFISSFEHPAPVGNPSIFGRYKTAPSYFAICTDCVSQLNKKI